MSRSPLCLVAALTCMLLCACTTVSQEPALPPSVPSDAFWVGGSDGGVFVRLEAAAAPTGVYRGAVYIEDGSIWFEGEFRLEPGDGQSLNVADRRLFTGWDGTRLLLGDGRKLVAVTQR